MQYLKCKDHHREWQSNLVLHNKESRDCQKQCGVQRILEDLLQSLEQSDKVIQTAAKTVHHIEHQGQLCIFFQAHKFCPLRLFQLRRLLRKHLFLLVWTEAREPLLFDFLEDGLIYVFGSRFWMCTNNEQMCLYSSCVYSIISTFWLNLSLSTKSQLLQSTESSSTSSLL